MKQKGFTLVELLAVIIILGAISLVVVPSIQRSLNKSNDQAYTAQVSNIESSAKNWAADHLDLLPNNGGSTTVTIGELIDGNYLEKDIQNPKTKEAFPRDTRVIIKNTNESYTYKLVEQ